MKVAGILLGILLLPAGTVGEVAYAHSPHHPQGHPSWIGVEPHEDHPPVVSPVNPDVVLPSGYRWELVFKPSVEGIEGPAQVTVHAASPHMFLWVHYWWVRGYHVESVDICFLTGLPRCVREYEVGQ